ncbi:hypothetical protein CYMTET_31770 [Cymbomonas tetramitiformis]|uniref:Uncharacterized protein n=1 Tax=Cymbomonas tetramitiformis TaxID=36881 RepID=A0AAE0FG60_9CHLO|nr:hypothetical protein CYMTET_31770 [Cymbomonas tetramitiformis]
MARLSSPPPSASLVVVVVVAAGAKSTSGSAMAFRRELAKPTGFPYGGGYDERPCPVDSFAILPDHAAPAAFPLSGDDDATGQPAAPTLAASSTTRRTSSPPSNLDPGST